MQPTSKLRRAVVVAAATMVMTASAGCAKVAGSTDDVVRNGDDVVRALTEGHPAPSRGPKLPKPSPNDLWTGVSVGCEVYKTARDPEQPCP
jgi:hypothetical protein